LLSMAAISSIRNAFYSVLLELFAYYKEFVGKDSDGEAIFDIKRFCQISNKQYRYFSMLNFCRDFYQQFFFNTTEKTDKLANGLF